MKVQSLVQAAQEAMLGAFDHADRVTAARLDAAAAGYSEITRKRARAGLTGRGIIIRGKLGLRGPVMYARRGPTRRPSPPRTRISAAVPAPAQYTRDDHADDDDYDDADDDADDDDYDDADDDVEDENADYYDGADDDDDYYDADESSSAGAGGWPWLAPIGLFACGLAAVVWLRRRSGAFAIADAPRQPLPAFTPSIAPRAQQTPARRAALTNSIVAPRPDDSAIFGPEAADEFCGRNLRPFGSFAVFPNAFGDFVPDSGGA